MPAPKKRPGTPAASKDDGQGSEKKQKTANDKKMNKEVEVNKKKVAATAVSSAGPDDECHQECQEGDDEGAEEERPHAEDPCVDPNETVTEGERRQQRLSNAYQKAYVKSMMAGANDEGVSDEVLEARSREAGMLARAKAAKKCTSPLLPRLI